MNKLKLSGACREKYLEEAFRTNRMLCTAAAVFCLFIEGFNIMRVLFFSRSGLGTLNNRIYFGFYLFLFCCSVLYLALSKKAKLDFWKGNAVCLTYASIVLLWNTCLNIYDILSSKEVHTIMAVSMLISYSALVVLEPLYGLLNIWANYFIFMLAASVPLFSGNGFNYTVSLLMGSMICIVRFRHLCIELEQGEQIKEYTRKLRESRFWLTQEQYELIGQNAGFITFQWTPEDDRVVFSKNWQEIFGHPYEISGFQQFIEQTELLTDAQKTWLALCNQEMTAGVKYLDFELNLPEKSGISRWFKVQVVRQELPGENNFCVVGFMNDITEEKKRLFDLEKRATMDVFTGLLDKASINGYGRRWTRIAARKNKRMAMMILDMDDFKYINDTYGHPCGDHVLKQVADILTESASRGAKIGRLGGDEFIVLFEVGCEIAHIYDYAEEVSRRIAEIQWEGETIGARCSIGFAVTDGIGWSYERLYQCADEALYTAKKKGKNMVWMYGEAEKSQNTSNSVLS